MNMSTIPSRYRNKSRYEVVNVATGYWVWDRFTEKWIYDPDTNEPIIFPYEEPPQETPK